MSEPRQDGEPAWGSIHITRRDLRGRCEEFVRQLREAPATVDPTVALILFVGVELAEERRNLVARFQARASQLRAWRHANRLPPDAAQQEARAAELEAQAQELAAGPLPEVREATDAEQFTALWRACQGDRLVINPPTPTVEWICQECRTTNPLEAGHCQHCNGPRPDGMTIPTLGPPPGSPPLDPGLVRQVVAAVLEHHHAQQAVVDTQVAHFKTPGSRTWGGLQGARARLENADERLNRLARKLEGQPEPTAQELWRKEQEGTDAD